MSNGWLWLDDIGMKIWRRGGLEVFGLVLIVIGYLGVFPLIFSGVKHECDKYW